MEAGQSINNAYLLTGGNIGNSGQHLKQAAEYIERHCGKILRASSIYETEPWGKTDQRNYLNQVLMIETKLSAVELIKMILLIEEKMGRKRSEKYGARIIDIDILFFNEE